MFSIYASYSIVFRYRTFSFDVSMNVSMHYNDGVLVVYCQGYCEMCRMYKKKFGGSTCSTQIISLTKQK